MGRPVSRTLPADGARLWPEVPARRSPLLPQPVPAVPPAPEDGDADRACECKMADGVLLSVPRRDHLRVGLCRHPRQGAQARGTLADMTSLDEERAEQSRWRARAKVDTTVY